MQSMKRTLFLQSLLWMCGSLSLCGGYVWLQTRAQDPFDFVDPRLEGQIAQTYLGPTAPIPGNPQLVRVEVLVSDGQEPNGLQILSASFNGTSIPLKPRDVLGYRGGASFQVKPGKYTLRWRVNRDRFAWPRNSSHEEIVTIDPRDLWLQISIEGDRASIR